MREPCVSHMWAIYWHRVHGGCTLAYVYVHSLPPTSETTGQKRPVSHISSSNETLNIYRPQTKFADIMFSQVSVCSRGWGVCLRSQGEGVCVSGTPPSRHPPPVADIPPGRHPPSPPSACWHTVNKRTVRIPLECILVKCGISER